MARILKLSWMGMISCFPSLGRGLFRKLAESGIAIILRATDG